MKGVRCSTRCVRRRACPSYNMPTSVFVMTLDYFDDDYKCPEGGSEVLGVERKADKAWKTVLTREFEKNKPLRVDDDRTDEEKERAHAEMMAAAPNETAKKKLKTSFDEFKKRTGPYLALGEKLKTMTTISKEFINEWNEAREAFLGDSEFGVKPTGHTADVREFELADE